MNTQFKSYFYTSDYVVFDFEDSTINHDIMVIAGTPSREGIVIYNVYRYINEVNSREIYTFRDLIDILHTDIDISVYTIYRLNTQSDVSRIYRVEYNYTVFVSPDQFTIQNKVYNNG